MLSSLSEIKKPEIKKYIDLFLKEILNNVDKENGYIKIHINPFYKIKDNGLDYPRQSFIYFTLSRVLSFLKENNFTELIKTHNLDEIINKISINIKSNYIKETNEINKEDDETNQINKKFIELYSLRACLFNRINDDYQLWADNFKKENINLIYTHPILLNLYLNTLKDIDIINNRENRADGKVENAKAKIEHTENEAVKILVDLTNYHLPSAVEAYYYSIKVRKDINKEAYNYTDMYYFNGIKYFNNDYYKAADEFIKEQLLIDDKNMDMLNTSTIAKLFEGLCNKSYYDYNSNIYNNDTQIKVDNNIQKYFDIVSSRKIKLDTKLIKDFKYTEYSISEIKNTSYVCLDIYAHLLLGLMPLFNIKQLDKQLNKQVGRQVNQQVDKQLDK